MFHELWIKKLITLSLNQDLGLTNQLITTIDFTTEWSFFFATEEMVKATMSVAFIVCG